MKKIVVYGSGSIIVGEAKHIEVEAGKYRVTFLLDQEQNLGELSADTMHFTASFQPGQKSIDFGGGPISGTPQGTQAMLRAKLSGQGFDRLITYTVFEFETPTRS